MAEQVKVGDPVLFYGKNLTVTELKTRANGVKVAVCEDIEMRNAREKLRSEIAGFRSKQTALVTQIEKARSARDAAQRSGASTAEANVEIARLNGDFEALAAEINARNVDANSALFIVTLRADLLDYWAQEGVWVSDGRILSDTQHATYAGKGNKVPPQSQRGAYLALKAMGEMRNGVLQ